MRVREGMEQGIVICLKNYVLYFDMYNFFSLFFSFKE